MLHSYRGRGNGIIIARKKTETYKGFSGIPRLNGAILRKKKTKKNNKPEIAVVIVVFIYNAVIDA